MCVRLWTKTTGPGFTKSSNKEEEPKFTLPEVEKAEPTCTMLCGDRIRSRCVRSRSGNGKSD